MGLVQLKKVVKTLKALGEFQKQYNDLNYSERNEMFLIIQSRNRKQMISQESTVANEEMKKP